MKRRLSKQVFLTGVLLSALAVSLIAGCGGGSEQASSSAPLTKKEFTKQANAICEKRLNKKDTLVEEGLVTVIKEGNKPNTPSFYEGLEKIATEKVLPIYEEMIRELQELSPPSKDEKTVNAFMTGFEDTLKEGEEDLGKLVRTEPFKDVNEEAHAYGLFSCSL